MRRSYSRVQPYDDRFPSTHHWQNTVPDDMLKEPEEITNRRRARKQTRDQKKAMRKRQQLMEAAGTRQRLFNSAISNSGRLDASKAALWKPTQIMQRGHIGAIYKCSYSLCGQYLVSCGKGSNIVVWETKTGKSEHMPLFSIMPLQPA